MRRTDITLEVNTRILGHEFIIIHLFQRWLSHWLATKDKKRERQPTSSVRRGSRREAAAAVKAGRAVREGPSTAKEAAGGRRGNAPDSGEAAGQPGGPQQRRKPLEAERGSTPDCREAAGQPERPQQRRKPLEAGEIGRAHV